MHTTSLNGDIACIRDITRHPDPQRAADLNRKAVGLGCLYFYYPKFYSYGDGGPCLDNC